MQSDRHTDVARGGSGAGRSRSEGQPAGPLCGLSNENKEGPLMSLEAGRSFHVTGAPEVTPTLSRR